MSFFLFFLRGIISSVCKDACRVTTNCSRNLHGKTVRRLSEELTTKHLMAQTTQPGNMGASGNVHRFSVQDLPGYRVLTAVEPDGRTSTRIVPKVHTSKHDNAVIKPKGREPTPMDFLPHKCEYGLVKEKHCFCGTRPEEKGNILPFGER
mgnify:CR=1 FL=1